MKHLLILLLLLPVLSEKLYPQSARAAGSAFTAAETSQRVIIAGHILNYNPDSEHRTISIEVPHLIYEPVKYAATIDERGRFKTEVPCAFPQEIHLSYGTSAVLFCIPGDSLFLEINAGARQNPENKKPHRKHFLQVKHGHFSRASNEMNRFLLEKPTAAYGFGHRIEAIKNKSPDEYAAYIRKREAAYRACLDSFVRENRPGRIFLKWADDHLKFESWESLLHYRWTHFPDRQSQLTIPPRYFSFLKDYKMDSQELFTAFHIEFLNEFYRYTLKYPEDSAQKADSLFEKGLVTEGARILKRQIQDQTAGFTRELFLAKFYQDALAGQQLDIFERLFEPGELKIPYFANIIRTEHEKLQAYFSNQVTAGANLLNIDSKVVEELINTITSKYADQVIYVDFWAPWCTPCMAEMPASKELQKEFLDEDVVFLFLASGCSEESWRSTIANEGLTGEHLLLSPDQMNVMRAEFGISGIPHYVVVDQKGDIILNDAPRPSDLRTSSVIRKLLN